MSSEEEVEGSSQAEETATEARETAGGEVELKQPVRRPAEEEGLGEEVGVLTIPLGGVWKGSRTQRTAKAMRMIRRAAARHLKPEGRREVKVSVDVNNALWSRGRTRPPRRVRVRVFKDEDGVYTLRPVEAV